MMLTKQTFTNGSISGYIVVIVNGLGELEHLRWSQPFWRTHSIPLHLSAESDCVLRQNLCVGLIRGKYHSMRQRSTPRTDTHIDTHRIQTCTHRRRGGGTKTKRQTDNSDSTDTDSAGTVMGSEQNKRPGHKNQKQEQGNALKMSRAGCRRRQIKAGGREQQG